MRVCTAVVGCRCSEARGGVMIARLEREARWHFYEGYRRLLSGDALGARVHFELQRVCLARVFELRHPHMTLLVATYDWLRDWWATR